MSIVNVYSSAPIPCTQLACALFGLEHPVMQVQLRPLSELPAQPRPCRRLSALEDELLAVTGRLVTIAERFNEADEGRVVLGLGEAPGLRAEADDLRSRQQGLLATIEALKGRIASS